MGLDSFAYDSVVALAAFLTSISKVGIGATMGVLTTPIVALVIPVDQAVGLLGITRGIADLFTPLRLPS